MNTAVTGLAIGIPLAVACFAVAWMVIRAMMSASSSPGLSPALIPLALLSGAGMVLYAANPELTELAGIASVGVGAMATFLASVAQKGEIPDPPWNDEPDEAPDVTEPVEGSDGIAPEHVDVPDQIEELGK